MLLLKYVLPLVVLATVGAFTLGPSLRGLANSSAVRMAAESGSAGMDRRQFVHDAAVGAAAGVGVAAAPKGAFAEGDPKVQFQVELAPGKQGTFVMQVHPDWAPKGAARFLELVDSDFFTDVRFFRVLKGFVAQFGISGDPQVSAKWRASAIRDDPVTQSNKRGTVVFATAGANTRTSQLFINFGDNAFLDKMGFSPIGEIVEGMDTVDSLYADYGEGAPRGKGPDQNAIQSRGNAYLKDKFPNLSYITNAKRI
ncbi:cyclophilin-like domain-containing protein [Tribonema minus]|uniref:Peptidyl-prolyl cis-trans isomerase n=1 Tax=Tribonema minus TaxID=303371 RepID=A0A835YRY8_9STRA|nr:cyclophilin-like domain-containing protein [Tribonema minus]|eukprot:TRINITY_DN2642_c0_g2_i1.p1 TRINITY_DN2642_c0_g2~~TRINITY_DN2642_c0_g2_i1.p1  ORF type:complete len:282 (-),score=77.88 TRINITY_DN2642_c0_g2_i1:313-1074(-)